MMIYRKFVYVFAMVLLALLQTYGQNESIKRSNNKVSLSGKNYYIHIVRKGETLTAISKAYQVPIDTIRMDNQHIADSLKPNQFLKIRDIVQPILQNGFIYHKVEQGDTPYNLSKRYSVTIEEIYRLNPGAELGIKKGDILKFILNSKTDQLSDNKSKLDEKEEQKPIENEPSFIYHKVLKQETIFGIARLYKTSQQEIEKFNPQIANRPLKLDEILKIPIVDQSLVSEGQYHFHKVLKQETIYGISKLYQISEKDINQLNPELKKRELIEGELIKIPLSAVMPQAIQVKKEAETAQNKQAKANQLAAKPDTIFKSICFDSKFNTKAIYKVAIFLPLYLNVNDTLGKFNDKITKDENGNDIVKSEPKQGEIEDRIYSKSKNFIEFYSGALLALNELKKSGVSFDVQVFDTRGDSLYLTQLMKNSQFDKFNLFIGPVFSGEISVVSDFAWEHQINIVSPLSVKSSFIEHNPYAFQVSPSMEVQMKYAAEFLNEKDTKNYIVIHDGNSKEQDYTSEFKRQLFSNISSENLDQIKYSEYYYFDANDSLLKYSFTPGIENIVIVPSSDRAFVTDLMGKLNGYSYEFNIQVLGQPRWERFESIELDNFHNTNTHLFSNSFIDYSKTSVIQFVNDYRLLFKTEPDRFAFQGYDITLFFCSALNKYGHDFRQCISFHKAPLLQTEFNFVPYTDQGGYQNTALYVLDYAPDYTLQKVATYPNK